MSDEAMTSADRQQLRQLIDARRREQVRPPDGRIGRTEWCGSCGGCRDVYTPGCPACRNRRNQRATRTKATV